MKSVKFTHTQFKTEVILYVEKVIGVFFAPTANSVVVLGDGGAAVPVEGTIEEVDKKIQDAKTAQ